MTTIPIACTLPPTEQAERQRTLQAEIGAAVQERVDLDDGVALRFPSDSTWIERLAALMVFERACCPFLTLEIAAEPNQGAVWLKMRGPEGTRAFLERSFAFCGLEQARPRRP